MADFANTDLLIRNAALEVELRMVKEQLAQAHQSTQYLLQLVSGSTPSLGASNVRDSRVQPQLQVSSWTKAIRRDSVVDTLSTAGAVDASSAYTADAQLVTFEQEPLLDHGVEETIFETPSLVPVKANEVDEVDEVIEVNEPRERAQERLGLGIVSDDSTPSTSFSFSTQGTSGFSIMNNDGTSTWISTPTIGVTPESSFSGMPTPRPRPFTGNEHRRFAGKAVFWTDLSADELTEVFAQYARTDTRHTAEEYRAYFEDVIRPEHEERTRRLQATRGALLRPFSDQQTEEPPRGRTLSRQQIEEGPATKTNSSTTRAEKQADEEAGELSEQFVEAQVAETAPNSAQAATSSQEPLDDIQESASDTVTGTSEESKLSTLENRQPSLLDLEVAANGSGARVDKPAEMHLKEDVPAAKPEISIGGYIPPRLYNPSALEDAKSLQAEFQGSGSGRARRPRERSYPELESSRHAVPGEHPGLAAEDLHHPPPSFSGLSSSRHAVSGEGPRVAGKDVSIAEGSNRPPYQYRSYITYPMEIEELFATPAEGDRSPYRTVLISNIPAGTMLIDVLDKIKGGRVYSAVLLETAGMRTNPPLSTDSALVTFVFGRQARFAADNWSDPKLNTTARLIRSISRPLPAHVMSDIHQHSLSRVLFVHDIERVLPAPGKVAEQLMRIGAQHPLKSEFDAEAPGLMLFHYASMAEAKAAWIACKRDRAFFGDIDRGFFADPCGTPIQKAEVQDEADETGVDAQEQCDTPIDEAEAQDGADEAGSDAHEQTESEGDQAKANAAIGKEGVVDLNKDEHWDWDLKYGFGIHAKTEEGSRMCEG